LILKFQATIRSSSRESALKQSSKTLGYLALAICTGMAQAGVPKDLPYPSETPSDDEIARQTYYVNHFYSVDNISFERQGKSRITVMATRAKDRPADVSTMRRFLNNAYERSAMKARDLALFHSGKLTGRGILVTEFKDDAKPPYYSTYLPALKKVRHFSEPAHDDAWSGSDLTYGDVYLRKPEHETHELVGKELFSDCLGSMQLSDKERKARYLKQLPGPQCSHKGKEVYKLKSDTTFKDWWYDYRVSYVDTQTFADYRTDYYKGEELIKRIDRDWESMSDIDDPRGVYWLYWYAITYGTGHETMIAVPAEMVKWNRDMENEFWSIDTLRQMRR